MRPGRSQKNELNFLNLFFFMYCLNFVLDEIMIFCSTGNASIIIDNFYALTLADRNWNLIEI